MYDMYFVICINKAQNEFNFLIRYKTNHPLWNMCKNETEINGQ